MDFFIQERNWTMVVRGGYQDKDIESWHKERDDNFKSHYGNIDDLHSK